MLKEINRGIIAANEISQAYMGEYDLNENLLILGDREERMAIFVNSVKEKTTGKDKLTILKYFITFNLFVLYEVEKWKY